MEDQAKYGNYSDQKVIELSKEQPDRIFTCENGRIAHKGMMFKDEQELKNFIKLISKPAVSKSILFFGKVLDFFSFRK